MTGHGFVPKETVKEKKDEKKIRTKYEKRFPKDLYNVKEEGDEIIVTPKDPRILAEAERLIQATGLSKPQFNAIIEYKPFALSRHFSRRRRKPSFFDELFDW